MHVSLPALMLAWAAVVAPPVTAQARPPRALQPISVLRELPAPRPRAAAPATRPPGWSDLSITVGGTVLVPTAASAAAPAPPPGFSGVQNVALFVPATGDTELFLLGTPSVPQLTAPLLVGFHAFGSSHGDLLFHTDFFAEAFARGWYVLAPLARSAASDPTANYGERRSIRNATAALEWVLTNRDIDLERIYGVGFSMGGGTLGSFMTHNLDPERGMLAAFALHTGSVDQADTYPFLTGPPNVTYLMDQLFGGPPPVAPFEYRRASLVQLDGLAHQLAPGGLHMAANLVYAPGQVWYANQDPLGYLVTQCEQLMQYFDGVPGSLVSAVVVNGTAHAWQTMSESTVCNFLAAQTLARPTAGTVIVDEDRRCFDYELQLDAPGQFGELDFDVDLATNRLALTQTSRVARVVTDVQWLGLDTGLIVRVELEALDVGDELVVRNVPAAPASVARDGLMAPGGSWSYDGQSQTLTIIESDIGLHVWEFQ
jgi:dienelactone hydrolase